MPNRIRTVEVSESERAELERRIRDRRALARDVARARIVLLSAQGLPGPKIAERVGCTEPTVVMWRRRFAQEGLAGLAERAARPPPRTAVTDDVRDEILTATLARPPTELGVTHWSSRLLADWLGTQGIRVSHDSISRVWRRYGIQPWHCETFTFTTYPEMTADVRDVVGLYLNPPENAVVVVVRSDPGQPSDHPHVRGLLAALGTATGGGTPARLPRHHYQGLLRFVTQLAETYRHHELRIVCDGNASHKHPTLPARLAHNRRITMHLTGTSASWLNFVEMFFRITADRAAPPRSATPVRELIDAIGTFVDSRNERNVPFTWIKDADTVQAQASTINQH